MEDPPSSSRPAILGAAALGARLGRVVVAVAAIATLCCLAQAAGLLFARDWSQVPFPFPLDYGEGVVLDQVANLAHFRNIYRPAAPPPPYTVTAYPPVYPASLVPFYWMFGPALWYGRALSALSVLVSGLFIGLTLRKLTGDALAAWVGGCLLLAFPYVYAWAPYFRIDGLALALSWAGLYVLVRGESVGGRLAWPALLLTAAIFTRQSYALAAPLAAAVWLWARSGPRRAFALGASVAGMSLVAFLGLVVVTHGGFWFNVIIGNLDPFSWAEVGQYVRALRQHAWLFLAGGAAFLLLGAWQRPAGWWLVAAYLVGASLESLTVGREGSSVNYMYELCAAFSLVGGAAVAAPRRWWLRAALLLLLGVQVQFLVAWTREEFEPWGRDRVAKQRFELNQLFEMVRRSRGAVLADEYLGMEPLAGKRVYFEPFETKQFVDRGLWSDAELVAQIRGRVFPLIVIYQRGFRYRWTEAQLRAIDESYEGMTALGGARVYVPRTSASR